VRELRFDEGPGAPQRVVVLVPPGATAAAPRPLLVALHGRGEAHRGLEAGAWGWVRDYGLDRTAAALGRPPLTAAALQDLGPPAYLAALNAALAARPYGGLVVACPFTPDVLATRGLDDAVPFGRFVVESLLPRLRRELPVIPTAAATGIDGVSLGGRVALLVGLEHPEAFGAVGTLQAAFGPNEIPALAARVRAMRARVAAPPRLRLLTSEGDYFKDTLGALAAAARAAGWPAELRVVPGPHDYDFNRGPGGVEMLLWHDRVLRGGP
jgi:acetyl esterase/lipase